MFVHHMTDKKHTLWQKLKSFFNLVHKVLLKLHSFIIEEILKKLFLSHITIGTKNKGEMIFLFSGSSSCSNHSNVPK